MGQLTVLFVHCSILEIINLFGVRRAFSVAECSLNFILGSISNGADPMVEWFFVLFLSRRFVFSKFGSSEV